MFVRQKTVAGRTYFYLVKSQRIEGRVKQINIAYLGTERPAEKKLKKIIKDVEKKKV